MPAIEAVHRAQYASATRGNAYSQKHIIERYDWAERERRRQMIEDIEFWERYVAEQRKAIADAKANGETPPTPLPHPDDVVIDYERGVRFIGPFSEDEAARLDKRLRIRDVFIMQDALDQRQVGTLHSDDPLDRPGTAWVLADLLNQSVPERYKLSETEINCRLMRYGAVRKRDLLKELYRAWRAVGAHPRRGKTSPPLRVAKQIFDEKNEAVSELRRKGDVSQLYHHHYERYWDRVIEKIMLAEWWNSARPKDPQQAAVWDGRAAFLDSLYYAPRK